MCGHSNKVEAYELESRPSSDIRSVGALILDFLASRIVRNKIVLFVNYPVYECSLNGLRGALSGCTHFH